MAKALQKATKGYTRDRGLTTEQQSAIDLLVLGKSDQETAASVGVHRVTVTKWRLYDAHFQAALNARRRSVFGAAADRLRALLPVALEVLEDELRDPENSSRGQLALALIKAVGLQANNIGPTRPQAVAKFAYLENHPGTEVKKYGAVTEYELEDLLTEWEHELSGE